MVVQEYPCLLGYVHMKVSTVVFSVLSSHDYDPEYVNLVRTVETYLQIIYLLLPILYHPVKIILACLYVVHEQTIL